MALQKQPISINFSQGLDQKSDPYQIQIGKFSVLKNSVFTKAGRLTKRFGFDRLTSLPNADQTTLTTLNDNLIATGSSLYAYSADTDMWLNQGIVQPVQLDTQALIRVSTNQTGSDSATATNGLVCLAYMDSGNSYYQISDSRTGQQIAQRTQLAATAVNPRVFILGPYFIVTYIATISGTPTLQYVPIPTAAPNSPKTAITISANVNTLQAGYDAYTLDQNLYVSWGESGAAIGITYISQNLVPAAVTTVAGNTADLMSVTADLSSNIVWITYWEDSSDDAYVVGYNTILGQLVSPTQIINNVSIATITSVAVDGVLTVFYQNINNYGYLDSSGIAIRSDYVSTVTVTPPVGVGPVVVGPTSVVLRSVGLASKAFIGADGVFYMMVEYGSRTQINSLDNTNQPSYFLINSDGDIYMRLAYSNGGGYMASQVLPAVSYINGVYSVSYRITDFLASVNKGTNLPSGTPTNAIYTQTGISLAMFTLNEGDQQSSEIANALHLTGGQLWEYDGVRPVEHGFQVWPEDVVASLSYSVGSVSTQTYNYVFTYEWTDNQGMLHRSAPSIPATFVIETAPVSFTANRTATSATLAAVSSFTGLQVGQLIAGTGIPANTHILSLNPGGNSLVMTNPASSGTATSTTITPTSLSTLVINVPTLRLTYKIAPNPVRIVGYRWSTAQQTYYQFTSLTSPTINNTTIDSVTFTDTNSDEDILGNVLLYTTGGVLENIAAPASIASALFDNRLWVIDAEDRNLLWFSKQVIQNVPVEMSDLLTKYVAPTTGAQGSTGDMTAISAMDDKLIIFKANAIYYINGSGPDNTGANSTYSEPIFITSAVGTSNPNSVVLIPQGLMFQSDKGIWLLGRDLSTTYIGAPVEDFNDADVKSAKVIPGTTQVRFTLDNRSTLMYDYFFQQWGEHSNVAAISATLYQGLHTYLNSYGQIFQESLNSYTDGSTPVLLSLSTSWISMAGLQGYERFYFANLLGTYYTPFKLNVGIAYDYNDSATQSIVVTPDNYSKKWGGEAQWGTGPAWGGPGNVFSARLFPEKQKCETFKISIQEVYDPQYGGTPGQGLSLSGLAMIAGIKKGYRTQSARKSFG